MSDQVAKPAPGLAVFAARVRHGLGWPGMLGAVLLLGAGLFALRAGPAVIELRAQASRTQAVESQTKAQGAAGPVKSQQAERALVNGAAPGELSKLLADLQAVVTDHGLAWPGAELAMQVATPATAARVDVRLVLRGGYLRIRQTLMRLGADVSGLTIRELVISRAGSEASEVEAKVVLGVFLRDGSLPVSVSAAP